MATVNERLAALEAAKVPCADGHNFAAGNGDWIFCSKCGEVRKLVKPSSAGFVERIKGPPVEVAGSEPTGRVTT